MLNLPSTPHSPGAADLEHAVAVAYEFAKHNPFPVGGSLEEYQRYTRSIVSDVLRRTDRDAPSTELQ